MSLGNYKELKKHKNFDQTMKEIQRLQNSGVKFSQIKISSIVGHLSIGINYGK